MTTTRMEAFSDGVLAIVITIMVLEIKVPHDTQPAALIPLIPVFLSYLLSFVYIGIYWNNHHHMLHTLQRVNGPVMLANLHLLFWLSLVPFATGWMGQNHRAIAPAVLYGAVMVMAAVAYFILQGRIIALQGSDSVLLRAVGRDWKGHTSLTLYLVALVASLRSPAIAQMIYGLVALLWLLPDPRIERVLHGPST
ncbi:MAG: TMEM175 family protein [Prochlorococcaceae cyanobacterium]